MYQNSKNKIDNPRVMLEKNRIKIKRIENNIINLVNTKSKSPNYLSSTKFKANLQKLLFQRKSLLNCMFQETLAEVERMKALNDLLLKLTNRLRLKLATVWENIQESKQDDFDDDFEIEGTLQFAYNNEDSVLAYTGDEIYGSNFHDMIKINDLYCNGTESCAYKISCRIDDSRESILKDNNLDDGISWSHEISVDFSNICICHTTAVFCRDFGYPIVDVLHMNDFWNEVHVRYQQFAKL